MNVTQFKLSAEARRSVAGNLKATQADLDRLALDTDRRTETAARPGLQITCMSDIKAKAVDWLWPNQIPLGKVTALAGEGGLGKSTILCDLAARVTTGMLWPDGSANGVVGNVLILASEDAGDDTIKPRLFAAGANMDKVGLITAVKEGDSVRTFSLQADLKSLSERIKEIGDVRLVIIDPISSYLGKVDSHNNAEVRSVLEPLGRLAEQSGAAFVCNNHFSKGGGSANNRIIGSVAFVNQARSAIIVTPDAEDDQKMRRLFIQSKTNLGPQTHGLAYRIGGYLAHLDGVEIPTSQVCWESEPVKISADAALAAMAAEKNTSALAEAETFLSDLLDGGPVAQPEIKKAAEGAGVSWATVRRAKTTLGVQASKSGFGDGWVWSMPGDEPKMLKSGQGAQASDVSTFDDFEHLRGG